MPVGSIQKPSIVVLPLQNLSNDPHNDYFSDGMTEEISTKLARIHELSVVSHYAAERFKGKAMDPAQVGKELQARYLLRRQRPQGRQSGPHQRATHRFVERNSSLG